MSASVEPAPGDASGVSEHSDAILERLLTLHPKVIDLSLDRLERLLTALGAPQTKLPPVAHVAGTNGKGSVCAFLRAGLQASPQGRVHAYTSPHLVRFHERIRLNGQLIDEARLATLLDECERANAGAPITFFEITTAAALLAFSRTPADWCVLEVGLGGRLDATNVVDAPALTVITPVSLDHQQFLGDTVGEIAAEKAGILKPGVPCVVAEQSEAAAAAIQARAAEVKAPLLRSGREWRAYLENGRFVVETPDGLMDLPTPRLRGRHQFENAGVAAVALWSLGAPEEAIAQAMTEVSWPGRLQRLRRGPLIDALPADAELWLDGGHNPAAGAAAAEAMAEIDPDGENPLFLVVGMLNTKDPAGFLAPFGGLARRVLAVDIPNEANALPPDDVAEAAVRAGLSAQTCGSVPGALRQIMTENRADMLSGPPRILICGSLYLAGQVLRENG